MITIERTTTAANGAALAAFLAAGIGAFAMGVFVILNEAGLFAPPALHAGAGGVSGRTTFAALAWLIAWVLLHSLWKRRDLKAGPILALAFGLTAAGIVLCFPPVWAML